MKPIIVDIHCHPTLKPYGNSFPFLPSHPHSNKIKDKNCIFHQDSVKGNKTENKWFGLTRFSQSDFTTLRRGAVNLIVASLYPIEKGFFITNKGIKGPTDLKLNYATKVGENRVDYVQNLALGYFDDLQNEYEFLKVRANEVFNIGADKVKYKLINSSKDIEITDENDDVFIINVMLSFEGAHVLFAGIEDIKKYSDPVQDLTDAVKDSVISSINTIKNWDHLPLFISFAHHFNNGLCGHAPSLTDKPISTLVNQTDRRNTEFTDFGREVIRKLLDNNKGKRILIDIKHMSVTARQNYFSMLDNEHKLDAVPIVVSHGCVRGHASPDNLFLDEDINFSDDEIIRIGKSKGLFGIQLDERRIVSKAERRKFKNASLTKTKEKVLLYATELVWRQIKYIAETLDKSGLDAWSIQSIGSDFDGIIDPIDGLWTAEELRTISTFLVNFHVKDFVQNGYNTLTRPENKVLAAEEIVNKIMGGNAYDFIARNR